MNLYFINEAPMQKIKNYIDNFKDQYTNDKVWLNEYFEDSSWKNTSRITIDDFDLLIPDDNSNYDLENSRIIYNSMQNLKPYQAVEERIWSYLTHVKFWDYMRKRWPAENYIDNQSDFERAVKERYFFSSKSRRALIRNGISRLWWFGYLTYDENNRFNPYALTEILLNTQDTAESVLGRNFSNNPKLIQSVLRVLKKWNDKYGEMPSRKVIRELCKHISFIGGVTILDTLSNDELEKKLNEQLKILNDKY
ncbi:MAG: DUF6339 family protein [Bacillota bacterium]